MTVYEYSYTKNKYNFLKNLYLLYNEKINEKKNYSL